MLSDPTHIVVLLAFTALLYFIWIMYRYILKVKKELYQTRIFDRVEVLHLLKRLRKCCGGLRLIFHNTHNVGSNTQHIVCL